MFCKKYYFLGKKGFSLVEIIVYIALVAMLLLVVSGFSISILDFNNKNKVVSEVEYQGLQTMQIITQYIRNADNITSPSQESSSDNSLTLEMLSGLSTPVVFTLNGGKIYINEAGGGDIVINNSRVQITNLLFQNLSRTSTPGTIRVSFTLTYLNPVSKAELSYSKNFYASASLR